MKIFKFFQSVAQQMQQVGSFAHKMTGRQANHLILHGISDIIFITLLLLTTTATAAPPPPTVAPPPTHVLLISIDGLSWPALQAQATTLPTLQKLMAKGASGPLESVFPTMTWAAHASLLSGQSPQHHGIPGNRFYDRQKAKWIESSGQPYALFRSDTLFNAAAAKGWKIASLFWPNTGSCPMVDWNIPEVYDRADYTKQISPKVNQLLKDIGFPPDLLPRVGGEESLFMDTLTRDMAVHLISTQKPQLVIGHFLAVDTAVHAYGPDTSPCRAAVAHVDRAVGDILQAYETAGLSSQLAVIVVSDHGFLKVTRAVSAQNMSTSVRVAGVPFTAKANGHSLFVYATGDNQPPSLAKLAAALHKDPNVEQIITQREYAKHGLATPDKDDRFPDLIAIVRPEILLCNGAEMTKNGLIPMCGMHGYLPSEPDLHGVFIAAGPGVSVGKTVQDFKAIDVAPTIAKWAQLLLKAPLDGRVRQEIFAADAAASFSLASCFWWG